MPKANQKIKPEDILIRYCAWTDISGKDYPLKIRGVMGPNLDWAYFLARARRKLLSPLIYKALVKTGYAEGLIPDDVWQELRSDYYSTLSTNVLVLSQLEEIAANLSWAGIDFLLSKGLALGESVYRDIGLRSSSDIDLLIKREDLIKLDAILEKLDYYLPFDMKGLGNNCLKSDYRNSLLYLSQNNKIPLHIHWHLVNLMPFNRKLSGSIDMGKIWSKAVPLQLGRVLLRTLSNTHQVIYLAMHAFSHGFSPLILLCDLNELIGRGNNEIDWRSVVDDSLEFGLSRHVFYALYLCSRLLDSEIPQELLKRLQPDKMSYFERRFISSVLEDKIGPSQEWLAYFGMNSGLTQRTLFLWRALFPPRIELALIRQKDCREVGFFDYVHRINTGINYTIRSLLNH